jgi:hypothetical protein
MNISASTTREQDLGSGEVTLWQGQTDAKCVRQDHDYDKAPMVVRNHRRRKEDRVSPNKALLDETAQGYFVAV